MEEPHHYDMSQKIEIAHVQDNIQSKYTWFTFEDFTTLLNGKICHPFHTLFGDTSICIRETIEKVSTHLQPESILSI